MSNISRIIDFDISEFNCPCCGLALSEEQFRKLALPLQRIRNDLCFPIVVTSGIRCQSHNDSVGGVSNSQHLFGTAADISSVNVCPTVLAMLAFKSGFRSIGIGDDFIHVDLRSFGDDAVDSNIWRY